MTFTLTPIGHVQNSRREIGDDDWGDVRSEITLVDELEPMALDGLTEFTHAEVIFVFDRVTEEKIERGHRHPRGNTAWPKVGIFAQRAKDRPNRLGSTIVKIEGQRGRTLTVRGLDAVDGTPVVDIKPVMQEFLPREGVRQPEWATELMREYWAVRPESTPAAHANMSHDVRVANTDDAPALAHLRFGFRAELQGTVENAAVFEQRCTRWMVVQLADTRRWAWRCWVAEREGALCGMIWLKLIPKLPNPVGESECHGYVSSFHVVPALRGTGIGTSLLEHALTFCDAARTDSVVLWPTARSRPLYARHGFTNNNGILERQCQ